MSEEGQNLGRKSLLVTLGVGACVVALGAALSLFSSGPTPRAGVVTAGARAPDPEVLALLGPELAVARRLDGLRVTGIEGVVDGAIRLELQLPTGEPFRVEILRKDPAAPLGIAETPGLSLYLIGTPGAPTPEEQEQALVALAARIAVEEQKGVPLPALRSLVAPR